jgi:hypothetical protein
MIAGVIIAAGLKETDGKHEEIKCKFYPGLKLPEQEI